MVILQVDIRGITNNSDMFQALYQSINDMFFFEIQFLNKDVFMMV